MSKRDTQTALEQIYSHAVEALDLVQGKSQREVADDRVLNLAITRLMEIIGEAANRIPK